jgi:hypothetical protein
MAVVYAVKPKPANLDGTPECKSRVRIIGWHFNLANDAVTRSWSVK